eukprot:6050906-Lingulodinium_polyedra.AAC.1
MWPQRAASVPNVRAHCSHSMMRNWFAGPTRPPTLWSGKAPLPARAAAADALVAAFMASRRRPTAALQPWAPEVLAEGLLCPWQGAELLEPQRQGLRGLEGLE